MNKIIIASGPVIMEDGKVLLDIQGEDTYWKFCGGKTREGESLQETAARRAGEELGIGIEILDSNPFIFYVQKETPEGIIDVIAVHFLAKRIGEVVPGEGVKEWKWIPLENIAGENLAPSIIPALEYFKLI